MEQYIVCLPAGGRPIAPTVNTPTIDTPTVNTPTEKWGRGAMTTDVKSYIELREM